MRCVRLFFVLPLPVQLVVVLESAGFETLGRSSVGGSPLYIGCGAEWIGAQQVRAVSFESDFTPALHRKEATSEA